MELTVVYNYKILSHLSVCLFISSLSKIVKTLLDPKSEKTLRTFLGLWWQRNNELKAKIIVRKGGVNCPKRAVKTSIDKDRLRIRRHFSSWYFYCEHWLFVCHWVLVVYISSVEKFKLVLSFPWPSSVLVIMIYCSVKYCCSNNSIPGVILHSIMKSIKTPNPPAYHWSTLWPLEVWVRGLYNS